MRKIGFLSVGIICGLALGLTASVYASSGLVGKTIQQEVKVIKDGQLIGTAIVVDGRSYAPVRAIGEAAGLKVDYSKEQITLTDPKPAVEPIEETNEGNVESNPNSTGEMPAGGGVVSEENSLLQEKQKEYNRLRSEFSHLFDEINKAINAGDKERVSQLNEQGKTLQQQMNALAAEIEALQNQ